MMKTKLLSAVVGAVSLLSAFGVMAKQDLSALSGQWVDNSGRGALAISGDKATFTSSTDWGREQVYELSLQDNDVLLLTPTTEGKTIEAKVDWDNQSVSYQRNKFHFTPAPNIRPEQLDGYWFEEAERGGTKHIRSVEYKDGGTRYDYYSWQVNPGYGTYSHNVDRNVVLQVDRGFIFRGPESSSAYVHYAVRVEDDTIHYVDRNGATWTETRTETLYQYDVPKGFRNMQDYR
ncbi:hypothetical protein Q7C_1125 [Methylophaga frappieri]|uniref:Uncharacterized protein n=1 Tax=Methylophaga frappieri (strain ATCC BAA-2434 / DSM 25690 / JAM7) TaxID=754477 RepID=I1YH87_METFJ|nr:hypothetical protein [Methylophaga frappieri]AFJ02280.1 hypothetical protein Q7C_1125 [Methylophaga frappieri]